MCNKTSLYILVSALIVSLVSGCSTMPYGNQSISLNELDGVWKGYGVAGIGYGSATCNINIPISFKVQNGRAVSFGTRSEWFFDVPLMSNGGIKFRYRKAITFSGAFAGTSKLDIVFTGQLSSDEGLGTFTSGGCSGKWFVEKDFRKTKSNKTSVVFPRTIRLPKSVHILEKQVVWEYGKQKFVVNKGDVLVVLASKICRTGTGECWKVMKVGTEEIGYVSAVHMKRTHRLSYE